MFGECVRDLANVLVLLDGRTGSAKSMQLWAVESKKIGWLGKSKEELAENKDLFRGYLVNRDLACKSQKIVLDSAEPKKFCWNDIRKDIISGDLGLNIGESDTLEFGENKELKKRKVMKWLLLLQSWTVDEFQVDMVMDAVIKAELSTEKWDLQQQLRAMRDERDGLAEHKDDMEIWFLAMYNKDIQNKIKSCRHQIGKMQVSARLPRWFVDKYFLNYDGKKMKADEDPIRIVHTSANVWTTDDLPANGVGYIPKSYFEEVFNGGQSYTHWHAQHGLYMNFRAPNLTYNATTEKLTFTAVKICATPSNYEQDVWQRYQ